MILLSCLRPGIRAASYHLARRRERVIVAGVEGTMSGRTAKFRVGEAVHHEIFDDRGVVADVEATFAEKKIPATSRQC